MTAGLPGLFVTGTDTGVGKTRVASAVASALVSTGRRIGVLKPVATGVERVGGRERCEDAERLAAAVAPAPPLDRVAPIRYDAPLAPPVAARLAGETLESDRVRTAVRAALTWWRGRAEAMVVEGVGGLLCPLAEGATVADLAVELDYPLVIVARRGLGTLNHTLLTVEAALRRGLRVAGVVLNTPVPGPDGPAERTNAEELARRLDGVGILAELAYDSGGGALSEAIHAVDWTARMAATRLAAG